MAGSTTGVEMIDRGDGVRLAVQRLSGTSPALMFLPGYMSDMGGTKAQMLLSWARDRGRACILMDYSGCGASEGRFEDGSISRWAQDVRAVVDRCADGPVVLVGSSMGGWVMLHVALSGAPVAALIGVAAAPDFTRWGLDLTTEDHEHLAHRGFAERPSAYGDTPYRYCRALIDDAATACVLGGPIAVHVPVRLLHGMADPDVPWSVSVRLAEQLESPDVQVTLLKSGDHRLSAPGDLALLLKTIEELPCA